jgi:hypothetical protein
VRAALRAALKALCAIPDLLAGIVEELHSAVESVDRHLAALEATQAKILVHLEAETKGKKAVAALASAASGEVFRSDELEFLQADVERFERRRHGFPVGGGGADEEAGAGF